MFESCQLRPPQLIRQDLLKIYGCTENWIKRSHKITAKDGIKRTKNCQKVCSADFYQTKTAVENCMIAISIKRRTTKGFLLHNTLYTVILMSENLPTGGVFAKRFSNASNSSPENFTTSTDLKHQRLKSVLLCQ